jgi:pyruvate/2-oxoglutarate dehydrogenase complex dihydrolipoamide dehydrogenase (E3) component
MSFDYNLVILGGSLTARHAAVKASRWGARVALVEPDRLPAVEASAQHQAAVDLLRYLEYQVGSQSGGFADTHSATDQTWAALLNEMDRIQSIEITEAIDEGRGQLAAAGVDVIIGDGYFVPATRSKRTTSSASTINQPQHTSNAAPTFLVNGQLLRSPNYLLASAASQLSPSFGSLNAAHCRTLETLWQQPCPIRPSSLLIVGDDLRGIELAQLFNRLDCQVTLLIHQPRLLAAEDPEVVAWLQAQLEAEGVAIITHASITQSQQLGNQIWLQVGDRALEADALLLAQSQRLDFSSLHLEAIGVDWQPSGVSVNQTLQTTHPRVYACGDALGGYALPHLADYEATIALKNILFGHQTTVDYRSIPWRLHTSPSLVRVGLTEPQAHRHCQANGEELVVLRSPLPATGYFSRQPDTGVSKLILRTNGEILGAHILAANATDWMSPLALAMKHHLPLHAIDRSIASSIEFSDWLDALLDQWQAQRQPRWQQELWENWFAWRR